MAAPGRRSAAPVDRRLFRDARPFSFFQAVRLLLRLYPERTRPGEAEDPRREAVRFASRARLDFPAGDVARAVPARSPSDPAELAVDVLGLAGARGPLPLWLTEVMVDRADDRDFALRDFLDVFNHRLVSLLFEARSKYRPQLAVDAPSQTPVGRTLFSFLGLGTPALRHRLDLPDRSLLPYVGLIPPGPRSQVGLERLLEGVLRVPVEILPFQGRWHALDPPQWTRIGLSGQNQILGRDAVLGRRVWDRGAGVKLRVGPVGLKDFLSLIPIGRKFAALQDLTRFYVRDERDFTLNLVLRGRDRPRLRLGTAAESRLGWNARLLPPAPDDDGAPRGGLRLGGSSGARLGWTSWLTTHPGAERPAPVADDGQVTVTLHRTE